jgi:hypothetical protein
MIYIYCGVPPRGLNDMGTDFVRVLVFHRTDDCRPDICISVARPMLENDIFLIMRSAYIV